MGLDAQWCSHPFAALGGADVYWSQRFNHIGGWESCLLRWGALMLIGVKGLITLVAGSIPGMLLHVICWCSLGVDFSMHFAIGFFMSITGGALVSQGTVSMGELSITLCCALCSFC